MGKKREVAIFQNGKCVNVFKPDEAVAYFQNKQKKREFQAAMNNEPFAVSSASSVAPPKEKKPRKQAKPKKKTGDDVVKLQVKAPKEKKKVGGGIPPAIILQYGRMKRAGDPGAIEFARKHGINVRANEKKVAEGGAAKKAPKLGQPPKQKEKRQKLEAALAHDATATEQAYREYHHTDAGEEYEDSE